MKPIHAISFLCLPAFLSAAPPKVDRMFSDHMVIQQDLAAPVWGTAVAGEEITVQFRGKTKTTKAGEDGKWSIKLDPSKVGEASELKVSTKDGSVVFKDVLVGEVWIGSGQSNMAGGAGGYARNDEVLSKNLEAGPYPGLRLYTRGGWNVADAQTGAGFSAIHFSFGLELHKSLGIPVGLMVGAVGGTPSGMWLSPEMAEGDSELSKLFQEANGISIADYSAGKGDYHEKWKAEEEKAKAEGKKAPRPPIKIGSLYERHIQYMMPYGIRGVLWDQGESKTQIPGVSDQYVVMNALVNGWRKTWGQGDFPFLHVQKPSGGVAPWDPENPTNKGAKAYRPNKPQAGSTTPHSLAYQLDHVKMGTIPNAPLVPAIDLGVGIHPACKSGYGARACQVALGAVYGKDVAVSGPVYKSHKLEGDKIRISFDHVGKGLAFRHADSLEGFEIGDGKKWAWAKAVIEGDTVVVSSPDIPNPKHVQYAFFRSPEYANFFNKDGLPAQPFTTVPWNRKGN